MYNDECMAKNIICFKQQSPILHSKINLKKKFKSKPYWNFYVWLILRTLPSDIFPEGLRGDLKTNMIWKKMQRMSSLVIGLRHS